MKGEVKSVILRKIQFPFSQFTQKLKISARRIDLTSSKTIFLIMVLLLISFTMTFSVALAEAIPTSAQSFSATPDAAYQGEEFTFSGRIQPNPPIGGYKNITIVFTDPSGAVFSIKDIPTDDSGSFQKKTHIPSNSPRNVPGEYSVLFVHPEETVGDNTYSYCESQTITFTIFPPDFALTAFPVSSVLNQGESTQFTLTVTPLGQWVQPPPGFEETLTLTASSIMGTTCVFSPAEFSFPYVTASSVLSVTTSAATSAGSHTLTIMGQGRGLTRTCTISLTVISPLLMTISPLNPTAEVGQSTTFTVKPSGGISPYTYQWYENSNPLTGQTFPTLTITKNAPGTFYYQCEVMDAASATVYSDTSLLAVTGLAPTSTPTPIPTPTPTSTPTASPSISPTPSSAIPQTPTPNPTLTPMPTITPTHTPTNTLSYTPTPAPTINPTPTPIINPTLAPTPTPQPTTSPTPEPTQTTTPTPIPTPPPTPVASTPTTTYATNPPEDSGIPLIYVGIVITIIAVATAAIMIALKFLKKDKNPPLIAGNQDENRLFF